MWESVAVADALSVLISSLMALSVGVLTSQGSESWSAGATPTIAHAVGGGHTALGTAQVRHTVHGA